MTTTPHPNPYITDTEGSWYFLECDVQEAFLHEMRNLDWMLFRQLHWHDLPYEHYYYMNASVA
jgi:hypothetical protein